MTVPAGDPTNEDIGVKPYASDKPSGEAKTFSQEQLNSILAQQRREIEGKYDGFDEIRTKAQQFDALTESTKSEVTRANEALADYKRQAEAAQSELAWRDVLLRRQEIAAKKGLDSKLWSRVKGETPEEIEADVSDLLTLAGARKPGALRSGATSDQALSAKERAAQALRGIREH